MGGWARGSRAGCDNLTQRQFDALTLYAVRGYVALTQDTDLRHYVTLTRGARGAGRGAFFIFFDCLLFFVLVPNCPRLAGRLCLSLAIDLE